MEKRNWLILIAAFFSLALLFGCPTNGRGGGDGKAANWGDYVDVDYTTYDEEGNVLDTSLAAVALNASIHSKERIYQPATVAMKENNGYISGFTQALLGMKEGEGKRVVVDAKDAYGERKPELVKQMTRFYNITRFEKEPLDMLESRGIKNVTVNKTIVHKWWYVRVMNISADGVVTLRHEPSLNQVITVNGMEQKVVNMSDELLFFRLEPQAGMMYEFPDPESGKAVRGKVTDVNATAFTLDYNHPLAGKKLVFELKVVRVS